MSADKRLGIWGLVFVASAAVLVTAGSCDVRENATDNSKKRAEVTAGLFKYIPDEQYFSLGFTDIDSILGNDWVQQLMSLSPDIKIWDTKLGIGIDRFHKIAMAIMPPSSEEKEPSALIIMSSDISEEAILEILGDKSTYFKKLHVGGYTQYVSGENFSFGFLKDGIVALGTPDLVKKSIELREGKGRSLMEGKYLAGFERYLGSDDDFWFGLGDISKMIEGISDRAPIVKNFSKIEFVYLGFKASEGIRTRVIMDCTTEKDAGKIARGLSSLIGLMSTLMDFEGSVTLSEDELVGISAEELKALIEEFFDNIEIDSRGKQVIINVDVPQDMIDFLIESSRKVLLERKNQLPDDVDRDGYVGSGTDSER